MVRWDVADLQIPLEDRRLSFLATEQMQRNAAGIPCMAVDAVVVGGGIQGLLVLRELRKRNYNAILLEKGDLGGAQTCSSHMFLHQGYLFDDDLDLAIRLRDARPSWNRLITDLRLPCHARTAVYGFTNETAAEAKTAFWRHPRLCLPSHEIPRPELFEGGPITRTFRSPEISLDGQRTIASLAMDLKDRITRIRAIESLSLLPGSRSIGQVQVVLNEQCRVSFLPKFVFLTAGAANWKLLRDNLPVPPRHDDRTFRHQVNRKAHMMVIRGPKKLLPLLCGSFACKHPLFIGSRDLGDEAVWLVSDHRSLPIEAESDAEKYDEAWWAPQVIRALQRLAPVAFRSCSRFQWGIYSAIKAEPMSDASDKRLNYIADFGFQNLLAIWPTKLTLAPTSACDAVHIVEKSLVACRQSEADSRAWRQLRQPVRVAKETWQNTGLLSWDAFRVFCRISS